MHQAEYFDQVAVIDFLKALYPDALVTISPEGMKLSIKTAVKLKNMGYQKGTPDIFLLEPRGKYYGLFIELKRKEIRDLFGKVMQTKGVCTKEQKEWIEKLNARGYKAIVCYGSNEAIEAIQAYLKPAG